MANHSATQNSSPGFLHIAKKFVLPLWPWYLFGTVALGITNYVVIKIPDLAKKVVNGLNATEPQSDLNRTALAIVLLGLALILIRTLSRVLIFWPGRVLEADLRSSYFDRFLQLPQAFFERFKMGDLISRLSHDIGQIRVFYAFGILQVLNFSYLTGLTITKMAGVHLMLTILCLLPLGLMIVVTRLGMPKMHLYSRQNQDAVGRLTNRITEAYVNIHTVQASAARDSFVGRIQEENEAVYQTNMKLVVIRAFIFQIISLLSGISFLVVLYYGGSEVTKGNLTIGDILAFDVYIGLLAFPLTALGMVVAMFQRARAATDRLQELDVSEIERGHPPLDGTQTEDNRPKDQVPILEVRNLTFAYPYVPSTDDGKGDKSDKGKDQGKDQGRHKAKKAEAGVDPRTGKNAGDEGPDNPKVLRLVSFKIYPGEKIGICGEVGSGKTSLFNLIARIYDPPPGTIFWKGTDVLELHPEEIRSSLGYAMQSPHLFSDSIESNLVFGSDFEASDETVRIAAKNAQIAGEIEKFSRGWQTEIGEKGVRLSGGQKQRLALARVFLRSPDLYLLDDVTSALDHRTEQGVIDYIASTEKSMIITSHRSSAFSHCDEVILFEAGRIVARGPLEEVRNEYPNAFLSE